MNSLSSSALLNPSVSSPESDWAILLVPGELEFSLHETRIPVINIMSINREYMLIMLFTPLLLVSQHLLCQLDMPDITLLQLMLPKQ